MATPFRRMVTFVFCYAQIVYIYNAAEGSAMDPTDVKGVPEARTHNERLVGEDRGIITWNSPRLLALKHDWESVDSDLAKTATKFNYTKNVARLDDILDKNLSEAELRELAVSTAALPVANKDRDKFTNHLLCFIVVALIHSGDREVLVSLLSTRFVDKVGLHYDVESYLVNCGNRLKEPILILGEAYTKSRVPEVRREIADVVRRAFTGLGVTGKDDTEFVSNAMTLYKEEKEQLTINPDYAHNAIMDGADYRTTPLFRRK